LFFTLRSRFDGMLSSALGMRPVFLSMPFLLLFVLGGATLGAAGSSLAIRRWLKV
jgi:hypothetical protein